MLRRRLEAQQKVKTVRIASARLDYHQFMVNPTKPFRMCWDLGLVAPLLLYLTVMMPYRLCFANEPMLNTPSYWFEASIELVRFSIIQARLFTLASFN